MQNQYSKRKGEERKLPRDITKEDGCFHYLDAVIIS